MKVIPTILAFDKAGFDTLWDKVIGVSDEVQVDLMDGRFVETKSISVDELPDVSGMRTRFEAHMMLKEPMSWVLPLKDKGFSRVIIHYEAIQEEDIPMITTFMEKQGLSWCLAVNPETPIERIVPHTEHVKDVLIMGVHPGRNHAPYVEATPGRVRELHEACPGVTIQVDGGMTDETIRAVVRAGATRINSGSFVGGGEDPAGQVRKLYAAIEEER